mmetsp:Transcript_20450/g.45698  ORF Transcript_20450/g.45698 Transcript_20450/m.45698 type:complete len:248 (+) Transcript_20450:1283-2026(+)
MCMHTVPVLSSTWTMPAFSALRAGPSFRSPRTAARSCEASGKLSSIALIAAVSGSTSVAPSSAASASSSSSASTSAASPSDSSPAPAVRLLARASISVFLRALLICSTSRSASSRSASTWLSSTSGASSFSSTRTSQADFFSRNCRMRACSSGWASRCAVVRRSLLKGSLPPRRMHWTATDRSTTRPEVVSFTGSFIRLPMNGSTNSSGSFSPTNSSPMLAFTALSCSASEADLSARAFWCLFTFKN